MAHLRKFKKNANEPNEPKTAHLAHEPNEPKTAHFKSKKSNEPNEPKLVHRKSTKKDKKIIKKPIQAPDFKNGELNHELNQIELNIDLEALVKSQKDKVIVKLILILH